MLRSKGDKFFGEVEDLKDFVKSIGWEHIYKCPYCEELRGKPDKEGKLYFNWVKGIGRCFKCDVIIFDNSMRSLDIIRKQLDATSDQEKYENQILNLRSWTYELVELTAGWDYMTKRRGVDATLFSKYNIRGTLSPKKGVVFTNKLIDSSFTDFLQIRSLETGSGSRYFNVAEQVKPLCWIDHVSQDSVMLIEGFISALSAYQHLNGQVDPLVMLGKSLSQLQLTQLKVLCASKPIRKVYIIPDGGFFEDGISIARVLDKELYNQEILVTKLYYRKDPNDLSTREFKNCFYDRTWPYVKMSESLFRKQVYGRD